MTQKYKYSIHAFFLMLNKKFHHNCHMQYRSASTKMDEDIDDLSSDFLPDLNNERTSEQLLFDSKVCHANEQFVRIKTDIIKCILSPPENRIYPQHVKNNKRAFQQTVLQYSYDKKRKKLFKRCICHNRIGK